MPVFTANNKETGDFVTLEPDTYPATFVRYEPFHHPEYGDGLKFVFHVDYEDDKGKMQSTEITGLASIPKNGALGLKHKLREWLEGIRGTKLADGETIDIDALLDTRCRLVLDVKEGKLRDDGTRAKFNRIDKIQPLRRKKQATEDEEVI